MAAAYTAFRVGRIRPTQISKLEASQYTAATAIQLQWKHSDKEAQESEQLLRGLWVTSGYGVRTLVMDDSACTQKSKSKVDRTADIICAMIEEENSKAPPPLIVGDEYKARKLLIISCKYAMGDHP